LLGARGSLEKVHNSCSFKKYDFFLRNTISGISDPICNEKHCSTFRCKLDAGVKTHLQWVVTGSS